jgi:hypothetical protein
MTLPDEAMELYRVAPGDFVSARNELATRLREEGRSEDADVVKALRKPTVVVWALDQLADRDPDGVAALLAAGRELRAAQRATMSTPAGADRFRDATTARRDAVGRLVEVALGALAEVGSAGRTQADAIAAALETASLDEESGERLSSGTLEAIPSKPAGFGEVFGLTALEGGVRSAAKSASRRSKVDVSKLEREHDAAVKAERSKRQEAERLGRQISDLRTKIDALETARAEAMAQARASALEAKRAARELSKAKR